MRIAVEREALLTALSRVSRITPANPSNPVLSYAKIEVFPDELFVSATDLATRIVAEVAGQLRVEDIGACLLPVTPLTLALRASNAPFVALAQTGPAEVQMGLGRTTYRWKTLPAEHFPDILSLNTEAESHVLDRQEFLAAVKAVKPAIPKVADARFDQIGIRQGLLQAADGVRYHQALCAAAGMVEAALPAAFVTDVVSLLGGSEEDKFILGMSEDKRALSIRVGPVILMTRAHAEPFPDITSIFTTAEMSNRISVGVDRDDLLGAIRRVRMMADAESGAVYLDLAGAITVSARQQSGSMAAERIDASYQGPNRRLTVHNEHLTALLTMCPVGQVELRLGPDSRAKPSMIYVSNDGRTGVIMQLRLAWLDADR